MKKVIAIDGPSGAGKSTIARLIAQELRFDYLDTGALYRALALGLRHSGMEENATDQEVSEGLKKIEVSFSNGHVFLNNRDVSKEIRSPEASHYASVFSARRPVRESLMATQRNAALHADLVAEGRDMTTVVFPAAYKKFYLDASVEERTRRRTLELLAKGFEVNTETIRLEIIERDSRDAGRDLAPLTKAPDSYLIDSTGCTIEEVFTKIMKAIEH